jgi:hypothetical protein
MVRKIKDNRKVMAVVLALALFLSLTAESCDSGNGGNPISNFVCEQASQNGGGGAIYCNAGN